MRRAASLTTWLASCLVAVAIQSVHAAPPPAAKAPPPELPAETLSTAVIDPALKARVYVADVAIAHISDGRIRVFDAGKGALLGMLSTAYAANFALSDSRQELYLVTTHMSRSYRGERVDVLEVYDTGTLAFQHEVVLPPKRAQTLNYRNLVRATANGRWLLVQNATPATSITVVDLPARKVVGELPTPGCWGIFPAASHPARFSMLCGDGSVATLTLDEAGQAAGRESSGKLFDPDADAWFHHAEQLGDRWWFLSFAGLLTELNLGGASARVLGSRSLVGEAERKAGWRPGGYQVFSIDGAGRWLVAAMHDKGGEGSHKNPARKLWVFDLESGKRKAVLPGAMALSVAFSRNGERLHALDADKGALHSWAFQDGRLRKLAYVPGAGEAAMQVESHD